MDVTISVLPHSNMATLTNASYGLSRFIDLLVQSTDLSVDVLPIGEMNLATGGTLALFFVDQETHGELLADFESDQLLRAVLNSFESPETNCALSTFDWNEQSEPAYAFFNILHEVDLEAQTNCIMDMAFRSVGMGGAPQGTRGIFSIPDWVGSHPEDSSLLDYGDRDRMFIDLFFRDEFEVGQEHAETLAEISGIVERECP